MQLATLGVSTEEMSFLDAPDRAQMERAHQLLERLKLVSGTRLTERGVLIMQAPLHPRLGLLLHESRGLGAGQRGALAAALVSERDLFGRREADTVADCDLEERIDALLNKGKGARTNLRQRVKRAAEQLRGADDTMGNPEDLARAFLRAFPDRVCQRVGPRDSAEITLQFANGRRATLSEASAVRNRDFMVAVDAEMRRGQARVQLASGIDPDWLLEDFPDEVEPVEELSFARERVFANEGLRFGALWLTRDRRPAPLSEEAAQVLYDAARKRGLRAFFDEEEVHRNLGRDAYLVAANLDPPVPPLGDDAETRVLRAACNAATSFAGISEQKLEDVLFGTFAAAHIGSLRSLAPPTLRLPSGREVPINYERDRGPWVESYLQNFFGMTETPKLAGAALTLHLLAPNKRALQVTTDLAGFWQRHYPSLSSSLARRYPKHHWPAEPRTAPPVLLKSQLAKR
jgi:ATP-dependent helicase HrpB